MSSVLITGGTGYIGHNLAKNLADGSFDVHVIVRPTSNTSCFNGSISKSHIHRHDGSYGSLDNIVKNVKPHTVFHLAALATYEHDATLIKELLDANVQFGSYLLEAMKNNSCHYLINTGTYWQHHNTPGYAPVSLYAALKQALEAIIDYYVYAGHLKVMTLKLVDVYGPNDTRKKLFNILKEAAITGNPLNMSSGEQLLDLVYIDDVIDAYRVASTLLHEQGRQSAFHKRYFVATNKFTSLKEVVNLYSHLVAKVPVIWGARPYREREVMVPQIGELLPKWQPKVSLREGLLRLFSTNKIV